MQTDSPRDPSYRKKNGHGKTYGVVTLTDAATGQRRDVLLGTYNTKASRQEYYRVVAEWRAAGCRLVQVKDDDAPLTVNGLAMLFLRWAKVYYRKPDGTLSREVDNYKEAIAPLARLYGATPARDFGPLALKVLQREMTQQPVTRKVKVVNAQTGAVTWMDKPWKIGWSRELINRRISRIRRIFKWGVSEQLMPPAVAEALGTVEGLRQGRCAARETTPIKPVALAVVEDTLSHLLPPVRAMVELQLLTGMRPGEVVAMRGCDLDVSGKVWLYRPASHKTAHHGHQRVVAIGPRGQEIVKPWLRTNLTDYLFRPIDAVAARDVRRRAARKSKVQPSQVCRKKKNPKRQPGERYTRNAYALAIRRACR